jgi:hypothetical protein
MKKVVMLLAILSVIGFAFLPFGDRTMFASVGDQFKSSDKERNELLTIASVLEEEQVSIQEWASHSREHLTSYTKIEDVQQLQTELLKEFPAWDWSIQQKNGNWEAIATNTSKNKSEKIQIMATLTNEQFHSYLIYEVKGTKWNKQTKEFFQNKWNTRLSSIFRGKSTNFSCMKADISDKIVTSLTSTSVDWLRAFKAVEVESLHETAFVSISASSPLFNETIQTQNADMNLQLAIRSNGLGARTTLVIGTPIITIEY